jgi:hypothetical protein
MGAGGVRRKVEWHYLDLDPPQILRFVRDQYGSLVNLDEVSYAGAHGQMVRLERGAMGYVPAPPGMLWLGDHGRAPSHQHQGRYRPAAG